jgi:hypothetical protein
VVSGPPWERQAGVARDSEDQGQEGEGQEGEAPAAAGLSEADVGRVAAAVAAVLGSARGPAQAAVQDHLSAPGDVAAIVRAELARKDAQARDEDTRQKVETHEQVLAKLQEDPPAAPVRRVERFMKWGG